MKRMQASGDLTLYEIFTHEIIHVDLMTLRKGDSNETFIPRRHSTQQINVVFFSKFSLCWKHQLYINKNYSNKFI